MPPVGRCLSTGHFLQLDLQTFPLRRSANETGSGTGNPASEGLAPLRRMWGRLSRSLRPSQILPRLCQGRPSQAEGSLRPKKAVERRQFRDKKISICNVFLLSNESSNMILSETSNIASICLHTHRNRSIEINQPHRKEGSYGGISDLPQIATSQERNQRDSGKISSRSGSETHPAVALLHRAKAGTGGCHCETFEIPTQYIKTWRPSCEVAMFSFAILFR